MIKDEGVDRVREQLMAAGHGPKRGTTVTDDDVTRLAGNVHYPTFTYLEMAGVFFAANFGYHMAVFRRRQNKAHFGAFMLVNAFTSYNLCEFASPGVVNYYAAAFNNTVEETHRKQVNSIYRR